MQRIEYPLFFAPSGITHSATGAVGQLIPWTAPSPSLHLASEGVESLGGGAFAITRTIENIGSVPAVFRDELRVRDCFASTRYLIPCVNYNGNGFGGEENFYNGRSMGAVKMPTGLACEGEPWIFSYERTGIPSCTLTEDNTIGLAVFAANDTPSSLMSSCSLQASNDNPEASARDSGSSILDHVIIRPVVESPYTYENKGVFGPRFETSITLQPGETFTAKTFVCICKPKWRNYAAASLIGHALALLRPSLEPCLSDDAAYNLGTRYIRSLFCRADDGKTWLLATNRKQRMFGDQHAARITREEMRERQQWEYWTDIATFANGFELGFTGQNFLNARLLAAKAFRENDKALLEKCLGVFDAFIATQRQNGLLFPRWNWNFDGNSPDRATDTCNLGWGAAEAVRMAQLLRKHGIEKNELVLFSRRICDFFLDHWSDETGFGKSWHLDGTPASTSGSIGGFIIPALIELHTETGEKRYLDGALRAMDFYFARDLDHFECTAGAIDCQCIDKETAYPFVWSALALYRITGDQQQLERAEKAAWYFFSWMFFFDTVLDPECDFARYGYHTTGGTSVSIEHQVIDPWGAMLVPELFELASATGNSAFSEIAKLTWANSLQGITTKLGEFIHDTQRPIGSQNEAFFQARYNKYRPDVNPGYFNDLLVSWPSSYRVSTVERLRERGITIKPQSHCKLTCPPASLRDAGDPYWIDVVSAGEFLSLPAKTILHSGPPIKFERMCVLHRRGMINACLLEGWATTSEEAAAMLTAGDVHLAAALDYATVGSGTGIVTSSVPLLIVEDRETGGRAGVFPGEGRFGGGFCGWGVYSKEIAANLIWMRDSLFAPIAQILRQRGGFPMKSLFAEARRMGDDLHSSQCAIDALFTRAIVPWALDCSNSDDLLRYFAETNRFTHNFGQAASRALLLGLEARGERGFLTAAGGNGVEYGVKFSGSDEWHVAPAPMIVGPYLTPGAKRENQLPWIGDSSITECRGWGGQIYPVNPNHATPGDGLVINGGMIDRNGGWMGAGSTRMPCEM